MTGRRSKRVAAQPRSTPVESTAAATRPRRRGRSTSIVSDSASPEKQRSKPAPRNSGRSAAKQMPKVAEEDQMSDQSGSGDSQAGSSRAGRPQAAPRRPAPRASLAKPRDSLASGTTAVASSQDGNELASGADLAFICHQLMGLYNAARQVLDHFFQNPDPKARNAAIQDVRTEDTHFKELIRVQLSFLQPARAVSSLHFIDPINIIQSVAEYGSRDKEATAAAEDLAGIFNEFNLAIACLKVLDADSSSELLKLLKEDTPPPILATWFDTGNTKGRSGLYKRWWDLILNLQTRLILDRILDEADSGEPNPQEIILDSLGDGYDPMKDFDESLRDWKAIHVRSNNPEVKRAQSTFFRIRALKECFERHGLDGDQVRRSLKDYVAYDGLEGFFDFAAARFQEIESRSGDYKGIKTLRNTLWQTFGLGGGKPYLVPAVPPIVPDKKKSFLDRQEGARKVDSDDEAPPPGHKPSAKRTVAESDGTNEHPPASRKRARRDGSGKQVPRSSPNPIPRPTQEAQEEVVRVSQKAKEFREDNVNSRAQAEPRQRRKWDAVEEAALIQYIGEHGAKYAFIKTKDGAEGHLQFRSAEDLRFKARNLKMHFYESRQPLPPKFKDVLLQKSQTDRLKSYGLLD